MEIWSFFTFSSIFAVTDRNLLEKVGTPELIRKKGMVSVEAIVEEKKRERG